MMASRRGSTGFNAEVSLLAAVNAAYANREAVEGELFAQTDMDGLNPITQTGSRDSTARDQEIGHMRVSTEAERRVRERIAELEATNLELETKNRELERFSYSVAHDLRSPLRTINGFSEMLQQDYGEGLDEAGRESLNLIRAAADRMGTLIDAFLMLGHMTRAHLRPEHFDLGEQVGQIARELRRSEPKREVELVIGEEVRGYGDRALLRVLLTNLLGNAWKFTRGRPDARVEFGSRGKRGNATVFFVKDNGIGFDQAMVDKLFVPFERLHDEGKYEGTGIGLATVERIIDRHGGHVWAEGNEELGATIYFTLPEPEAL